MSATKSYKHLLAVSGIFSLFFNASLLAAPLQTPHSFVSGEAALAQQVNENFTAIENAVNDNDSRLSKAESRLDKLETTDAVPGTQPSTTHRSMWLPASGGMNINLPKNSSSIAYSTFGKPVDYQSDGDNDISITAYISAANCEGDFIAAGALSYGWNSGDGNGATPTTVAVKQISVPSDGSASTTPMISVSISQTGFKDVNVLAVRRSGGDSEDSCASSVYYYGALVSYPAK